MPWIDELPAELADTISDEDRTNPLLAKYNNLGEFVKGQINAQSLLGNSVRVPGPDAPDSDRQEFYQKLIDMDGGLMPKPDFSAEDQTETFYRSIGKPADQEQYSVPDGVALPAEIIEEMKTIGFQANMTAAQFNKWASEVNDRNTQALEHQTGEFNTSMTELKNRWGMAFDDRTAAAQKINEQFYPGRDFDSLTAKEREALYNVHTSMTGKGPQVATQEPNQPTALDVAEVEERAEEMQRKIFDPASTMSPMEKTELAHKRIKFLQANHPKYQKSA